MITRRIIAGILFSDMLAMEAGMDLMDRITFNPAQCGGQPCIRGMRIRVNDVFDLLAAGLTAEQVVEELPDLELADVQSVLQFAARRV